jgi:hypothetical protein
VADLLSMEDLLDSSNRREIKLERRADYEAIPQKLSSNTHQAIDGYMMIGCNALDGRTNSATHFGKPSVPGIDDCGVGVKTISELYRV